MKKIGLSIFLILCSTNIFSSPEKQLYVTIKGENVCVYTKDLKAKPFENKMYLYMGDVTPSKNFKSTYSKLFNNMKVPVDKVDCIPISSTQFKNNTPYDIVLDMDQSYSIRICVEKRTDKVVLRNVVNGFTCSTSEISEAIEKEQTIFKRILNWFVALFL
ncbi:NF045616 family extracytoplasmic (lipo)protein [Acinetobacter faecalis]|uniref:NF045616 family extracytoplasmic (lipo)protein n=1 Tax=Acinetobacter faecalis TaxID=2665161 RepID=UPI002A91C437|nr:NF045616 family extracytoplasmic (lipo)protein [Acinetobacter faecalis]MDY6450008.1 hypothetical protein [Acinetobacter faecalis]MDY6456495.1 hypothetical protein [Acinetobacter faecalis]